MRELDEVQPIPSTREDILRHGLAEIAALAPGGHADPNNPGYGDKVNIKEYALRILAAADAVRDASDLRLDAAAREYALLHYRLETNSGDVAAAQEILKAAEAAEQPTGDE